ncbi:MAG TPA: hypothetical protein VME24_12335 [Alphaproteobacteria bacterium]|nr:hypothetical protein [Alphaproteobacteria bacterium]
MRNVIRIPIVLITVIALAGCQSHPAVQTKSAAPAALVMPPFQPMLMTNFYAQTSNDGACRIDVSETNVAVSHFPGLVGNGWPARAKEGENTVSLPWNARTGWLVFAENNNRVWAYDGDGLLFLFTYSETWNKECWGKARYGSGPSYGDPGAPVPVQVFSRLPETMRKKIKNHG